LFLADRSDHAAVWSHNCQFVIIGPTVCRLSACLPVWLSICEHRPKIVLVHIRRRRTAVIEGKFFIEKPGKNNLHIFLTWGEYAPYAPCLAKPLVRINSFKANGSSEGTIDLKSIHLQLMTSLLQTAHVVNWCKTSYNCSSRL